MSDLRARAQALRDQFVTAGAQVVDPPVLQPADLLLDLYGEDIRGRAYVTSDAMRGEQIRDLDAQRTRGHQTLQKFTVSKIDFASLKPFTSIEERKLALP